LEVIGVHPGFRIVRQDCDQVGRAHSNATKFVPGKALLKEALN
jgi:hypothetical protein